MPVRPLTTNLEAALQYAERGWYVAPLCWPACNGSCSCGRKHDKRNSGKAPLTPHGINDSTTNQETIHSWWTRWPNANIAIDLRRSGLLVIAPDAPEWLAEFQKGGLGNPLGVVQSGGGEGHFHFYYSRPPDCPIYRINRPGEFDIQTDGYMVAPPSLHQSGRHYLWIM